MQWCSLCLRTPICIHPPRTPWTPGSTWEEGHRRRAPFTPSTTSENTGRTEKKEEEELQTNMKMRQKKSSKTTVDDPPLCVNGGERTVECDRHRNQSIGKSFRTRNNPIPAIQHLFPSATLSTVVKSSIQRVPVHPNDSKITSFSMICISETALFLFCSQRSPSQVASRLMWDLFFLSVSIQHSILELIRPLR